MTLREVDGGPGYYGKFSAALPSDRTYFPIGVWGEYDQTAANRDLDAAVGLNTYVWAADNAFMDDIRADPRFRVIQDHGNRTGAGSETAGWGLGDEVDMCCGPPGFAGGNGYQMLTDRNNGLPGDGKLRYTNYGKGVMFWQNDTDAARFVNLPFLSVVSNDVYWFTDPNERSRAGYRVAASYGDTVARMRMLDGKDGQRKPIWNFVEAGWPFTESAAQGGRTIAPAELNGAVWQSLIAGARGIVYFNHSFAGPCQTHHVLRNPGGCYTAIRAQASSTNSLVKQLAPQLNSPTADGLVSTAANVRTMAKWDGANYYLFTGNGNNTARSATFDMPCVGDTSVTVVGEGRSIPVSGGKFTDQFADGNAIHIYRVDGGSSCGVPRG